MTRESEVERLRRCRALFEQAQAAGTTPAELAQRQAIAGWAAIDARLAARRAASRDSEAPAQPWMMRD